MPYKTHEEYFAAQPEELRARLEQVRSAVESQVPEADRTVSYGMPAFKLGRTFFYFAAFRKHIGIYPPVTDDPALVEATAIHRGPKGNLSFPHTEELPLQLIARVAAALAAQYRTK